MSMANDPFSQLLARRCQESIEQDAAYHRQHAPSTDFDLRTPAPVNDAQKLLDDSDMDFLCGMPGFLESAENFDLSHLLDLQPEELLQEASKDEHFAKKRKADNGDGCRECKQARNESVFSDISCLFPDLDTPVALDSGQSPGFSSWSKDSLSSHDSSGDSPRSRPEDIDLLRSSSPCSDVSDQSYCGQSVEYHFQKIQDHIRLAVDALKRGQYERNKNIVTWAHELKNKTFSELKKEAEKAWDSDKDRDATPASRPKPAHGSTKRVEQFRKNMRRWMIGTQAQHIGVEWMVYARMEHLQAISKYILGDALPADPASPTAVAESIMSYLGHELPLEFVDGELAEPEPGKRYTIGAQLVPALQDKCFRKVPTLAFTMPPDGDEAAMASWVARLRSLFPVKPAPKMKAKVSAQ